MNRVLVCAVAVALLGFVAAPATAEPTLPVSVTTDNGGVQVRSGLPGQPLLGVSADDDGVCVGFSYQQGTCLPDGG